MSSLWRRQMALTARARSSTNKPLSLDLQVPTYARKTYNHKIYWSKQSHHSAASYNYIAEVYDGSPCLRRWLEFCYGEPEPTMAYLLCYKPPTIQAKPERIWTVYDGVTPVVTYTNCLEAFMIAQGARAFGNNPEFTVHYIDRTG